MSDREADRYLVKEIFKTVQGEGFWSGRPAVFIRFVGCNMWSGYEKDRERDFNRNYAKTGGGECALWCDTDFTKQGAVKYTAVEIAAQARKIGHKVDFCVLTGGEPFLHIDGFVVAALKRQGFTVAVETNGTCSTNIFMHPGGLSPDWICCSPKVPEAHIKLEVCHELKLVLPSYSPSEYRTLIDRVLTVLAANQSKKPLYLQPCDWDAHTSKEMIAKLVMDTIEQNPQWSISLQSHKILGVE